MSELTEACEEIALAIDFHIQGCLRGVAPGSVAADADAVTTYYQAIGICELLLDAEVDAFFHHLIRSAQARRWLLDRSRAAPGHPESVIRASNTSGLFGAIAAFQWPLARDVAARSPVTWLDEVEYEDDFCYSHFLHRYLLSAPEAELASILTRFEAALEGQGSARLGLCRVLSSRDRAAGAAAFEALIEEQSAKIQKMQATSIYATEGLFLPLSSIFIEGLAWLSLLDATGIVLAGEYMYCPSLARKKGYAPFEVSTFPALPL